MHPKQRPLSWNFAALEGNNLIKALPELGVLRHIVESSDWHEDDAFQQSLHLFHWVERLPASLDGTINMPEAATRARLTDVVDTKRGRYTTQKLLAFAALIHDVGKAETFQRLPDGTTSCPGHEAVSARLAPAICSRFDFTPAEARYITSLVRSHGEPYALYKTIVSLPASQRQEKKRLFEAQHAHDLLSLLLLASGDLLTSDLSRNRPHKFEAVLNFYRRWMQTVRPQGEQEGARVECSRTYCHPFSFDETEHLC